MRPLNKLIDWYFSKNALPYWVVLLLDLLICYLSGIFVFWLYYRGAVTLGNIVILSKTIAIYMVFNLVGFRVFHTYSGIIRYSSFVDLQRIVGAMVVSLACAEAAHYLIYFSDWHFVRLQGRQIAAMYLIATIGMFFYRILVKNVYDVVFDNEGGSRTFIYGIGDSEVGLAKNIRNEKPVKFSLCGFITNDASLTSKLLFGQKVYSVNDLLTDVIERHKIKAVLVSSAEADNFRNDTFLQDLLLNAHVEIYMMEEAQTWNPGDPSSQHLRQINVEDLLPREPIEVDMHAIGEMLKGRRIMVTGSAGSIGSEMVRQIASFKPASMMLIDSAETPQHDIRLLMASKYRDVEAFTVVASIANHERMEHIFNDFRPDYVFHAAAYKHVPMMENNPSESVQNNIWGTKVIADLSVKYGVKKFVMLSTDKAVNPTNVMGCSKRICEIYVQSLNKAIAEGSIRDREGKRAITQFITTRFGNVLGSNGSVIPLFKKEIEMGGPLTVTDPNITRFFMLIPEAVRLVLEAGTHGKGGEIFVFDMGKPVRIADLARRMILISGATNVEIKYTGLRAGEKLYEEVLSNEENTVPSFHKRIRIALVREYSYAEAQRNLKELIDVSRSYDDMAIVKKMKEIVPEYISNNSKYEILDKGRG